MGNKIKAITLMLLTGIILLISCESEAPEESSSEAPIIGITDDSKDSESSNAVSDEESSEIESSVPEVIPEPEDDEMVLIKDYIPEIIIELRYATSNNFTGEVIYESSDAYLRYGTVKKLKSAYTELKALGYNIKVWDAFRPTEAQWRLWDICPDPTYVSDPSKGYSNHSRGIAIDITLTDKNGNELEMPSEFDEFGEIADRDYSDATKEAAQNATLLESVMIKHGFTAYKGEWWHFADSVKYEVYDDGIDN